MTDTIKISRDELQRIAQGCSCEVTTDALDALLATPPADAADMGGQAGEEVEVRGLQWLDTGHYRKKPPQFGYNPHDWNPLMTVAQHIRILAARDALHREQAGKLAEALRQVRGYTDSPHVVGIIDEALADWEKTQ